MESTAKHVIPTKSEGQAGLGSWEVNDIISYDVIEGKVMHIFVNKGAVIV